MGGLRTFFQGPKPVVVEGTLERVGGILGEEGVAGTGQWALVVGGEAFVGWLLRSMPLDQRAQLAVSRAGDVVRFEWSAERGKIERFENLSLARGLFDALKG